MDMEKFDPEKAARVWERVQSRQMPELAREDPAVLIREAAALARMYRALAKQIPGADGERLGRMSGECRRCADCLRGIGIIRGGKLGAPQGEDDGRRQSRRLLESCCHRERDLQGALSRQTVDPEWGHIYRRLAEESERRCTAVLELLGSKGR